MKKTSHVGNEALRGLLLFGMLLSGFGLLMSPNLPLQDATHSQALSFRTLVSLLMGAVFVACAIARWQLTRQTNGPGPEKEKQD